MKSRKAIVMARVSSDEQAKGYSLDIQEESIKKWCVLHNVSIVQVFREDHSAKDFNRPQWKELKKYAKSNKTEIDLLLFTTWDRFSRNTTDAFNELFEFKKIGIEVQSILQPIDFSIPESKVLLAIYLTLPEVDNDRRSMKIREGVRAALVSGRWSRKAPFGYSNTRDKINKPHIVPNENAHLIKFAFEQVADGVSQEFIRVQLRKKGLIVSRANISRMLRNLVYLGKIIVPVFENEPEMIVEGLHDGIVDAELFYKVQEVLKGNIIKANKAKQNCQREELPLRGILYCSICSNKVTGSASKSATGAKHFYYHCNHCKRDRYNAKFANKAMEDFFKNLKFQQTPKEIYKDMLESIIGERSPDKKNKEFDEKEMKSKIEILDQKIDKIQDLLIDGVLSADDYNKKKNQFEFEINKLKESVTEEKKISKELKNRIESGINFFTDAGSIYLKASVQQKQKIISSTFPEKIIFENKKCRTLKINDLLQVMLLKDNDLFEIKKGQINENFDLSRQVE